nr:TonB family protein [uncultured Holophaga sp.]
MSKDPTKNGPPPRPQESLEEAVYKANLSEGNASVRRASPAVTIPATIVLYAALGLGGWYVIKTSKTVQKALKKTVGIDLNEQKEEDVPPPPPPPPPAPAPVAPPKPVEKDAPPPPPAQETVPELAPKELPKQDLSLKYAQAAPAASSGPTGVTGPAVAGAGTGKVQDFDFSQIRIKYQPPAPPYPAIAKLARIQGTVVVQITIDTEGVPTEAQAMSGPPQLRATAEAYARRWRFEPATVNGTPVMGRFTLTMPFRLH